MFIECIRSKGQRIFSGYVENHHIIPKCLNGKDTADNLIKLTLREHFLAHWLLWKAYPNYLPLASAFLQMNNKNPKLKSEFQGRITSRTYEKLKNNVYDSLKTHIEGYVYVKDLNENVIKMTKEEYASQTDLKFHTSGKINVFDLELSIWVYIDTIDYHRNKERYKTRLSEESPIGVKYKFIDTETNEVVKITKTDAAQKNKEYGYKRLKHIQNHKVTCIDQDENKYSISLEEYKSNIHQSLHSHLLKGKLSVFDIEANKYIQISKEEYISNKNRYLTSTKGKVLAKDAAGNNVLISKKEFEEGNYVGQTKGLRTVMDKNTGEYVQINEDEYLNNKHKYAGPNKGKVNVIDKITGERKQISKIDFDTTRYCGLGNKKFLFLCRNILTQKEKYINIYEWHLVNNEYNILDHEKYLKALAIK